jgi:hypothetical protein
LELVVPDKALAPAAKAGWDNAAGSLFEAVELKLLTAMPAADPALPRTPAPEEEPPILPAVDAGELAKADDTACSQSLPSRLLSFEETNSLLGFKASLRKPPELL